MATRIAVGIMREQAMNAIADATGKIALALGIDAAVIPTQGKDADLLYAQQLTAIADYLGSVAVLVTPKSLTPESEPAFVSGLGREPVRVVENDPSDDLAEDLIADVVVENDPPIPDDAPKARRKGR